MQYFLGLHEFTQEPLFDASMMVHFRKRFPVEDVARINEYVCTGKWPEDGRNVDRNDGVPEEIETPEPEEEEDDHDDSDKPSGGKKSLKAIRYRNSDWYWRSLRKYVENVTKYYIWLRQKIFPVGPPPTAKL